MREDKPTNCHYCGYCCAFIATVEDGKLTGLRPDPTRYPYGADVLKRCHRWPMNVRDIDAPDRVNYPLKRVGGRGEGQWQRVTWDQALQEITDRLKHLIDQHGPATVASAIGGPHASFWPLHRFMNGIGSPNNMGIGQICWNPRIWMDTLTYGWTIEADIIPGITDCVVIWGTNPAQSDNSAFWQALQSYAAAGINTIVIDPRYCETAEIADLWLPVVPGTDCILALGVINSLLKADAIDHDFVATWCVGLEELAEAAEPYTVNRVATECGLTPEQVQQLIDAIANAGALCIVSGRGIDQVGRSTAPTHRAITAIRALKGAVDRPGCCLLNRHSDFTPEVQLERSDVVTADQRAACLNTPFTPLQSYEGYDAVKAITQSHSGNVLPQRYMTSAHPHLVLQAMETGQPYPVRALIVNATNPVLTYADTHRVYNALMGLDLLVALEYRVTPTAALADYVLPIAGAIERPIFQIHGGVANMGYGGPAAVKPYYQRKTDYEVFRELGLRMGQTHLWPQETLEEAFDAALQEAGTTWDDFCQTGLYGTPSTPYSYATLDENDQPLGFATPSGKIELTSNFLRSWGGQAVPAPGRRETLCSLETRERYEAQGYTHIDLITGARKQPYNASMYFFNEKFRQASPYPVAEVSPNTAHKLGLQEGESVELATDAGTARFRLAIAPMRDDLVSADYGWWHGEEEPTLPDLGGIWESNVNTLTRCFLGESAIGTWAYNALDCMIGRPRP